MRSKLFVPGSRPELFEKALASRADGVSFDLEDAVAQSAKSEARSQLASFLASLGPTDKTLVVRVNGQDTAHYHDDLEALVGTRLDVINLPKVEDPEQVLQLVADLQRLEQQRPAAVNVQILANIESPRGLRMAAAIASAHPRVMGLQLGFADLLEPLGINRHEASVIRQIQLAVRMAAGEANVAAYDAAFAAIKNVEGYREEARFARSLGFTGKSCIHPTQIDMANEAFVPAAEEIERAKRVLAAADEADAAGVGAYTVDGHMVDAPFVRRARIVIEQARQAGLLTP